MLPLYFCPLSFFFFFLAYSQQLQIGCLPYLYTWCGPSVNLECRSEMWYNAHGSLEIQDTKMMQKIAISAPLHNLSGCIFATKACIDNRKNLLSANTSSTCPELWPTNGWDRFRSLGHPWKFQWVSRLGSITAPQSSSGRQPNFAALNRWCHIYLAGQPSRWALAHILVFFLA